MTREETEGEPRSGIANFKTRRHPRFLINLPIKYWRRDLSDSHISRTVDVSEGGLMVSLPEPIEIGRDLRLNLFYAHSPSELSTIEALVQVVWRDVQVNKDGYYKTGVKFVNISAGDLDRWKHFLNTFQIS